MYFLPENEIKTCSVYSRLEKNFQLMRIFDVHDPEHRTWNYHSVTKYGSELIFYLINYDNAKISCFKFDHKGLVSRYDCGKIPREGIMYYRLLQSIPVIAVCYFLKDFSLYDRRWKKLKIRFFGISGNVSDKFCVKNISFKVDSAYDDYDVLTNSNYIAVFIKFYYQTKSLEPWRKKSNESILRNCSFVLFEIQLKGDNYYECIEISRIDLQEYVKGKKSVSIGSMKYIATEEKILFPLQMETFDQPCQILLILYNIKTRSILQTFAAVEKSFISTCMTYFFNHIDFERGIIIVEPIPYGEMKLFTRTVEDKFIPIRGFAFESNIMRKPLHFTSICKNQLLIFKIKYFDLKVCDLFDDSNGTYLQYGDDLPGPALACRLHFNETGEEVYICSRKKMYIYLCKPVFKTLTLLIASVVSKTYAKSKLLEMRLPKQLHKYF